MSESIKEFPRGVEVIVGPYILNNNNEVMFCKSPKWPDQWVICGGHVESGENLSDALKREVKEELGIDIDVFDIVNVGEMIVSPPEFKRNAHFVFIDMMARPKDERFSFNNEISSYKWFNIDEALSRDDIKASYKNALNKIKEIIEK